MSYNKFIILYTSNFCARVNDFFCVDEWMVHGYDVEYWDLSAFTCHETLAEYKVDGLTIRKIKDISEFTKQVIEYKNFETLYLTWINYCWYSAQFYEILSKYNCSYAYFDNGLIPPISTGNTKPKLSLERILHGLRNRYYEYRKKSKALKPAKYYFRLSDSFYGVDKVDEHTKYGWCNSGDFERNKRLTSVIDQDYIVFLDQYIPYHNDVILNGQRQVDPDSYFESLNRCFSIIEKKYNMPVIIAAHPAANKYKDNNPFNGRNVIFNKTSELVKNSKFVLAHFTTAISYVVLNQKPMMLLNSNAIKDVRPQMSEYIIQLSELLGLKCINQDTATEEDIDFAAIDQTKYNDYKYTYLTNHYSEKESNFDSIIRLIEN